MKQIYRLFPAGTFFALTLGMLAQAPPPAAPVPPATPSAPQIPSFGPRGDGPRQNPSTVRFDLDFKGGTPGDLLDTMMKSRGVRPNVVIHPECVNSLVPAFKLREVTAGQVFESLNAISEPDFKGGKWRRVVQDDGETWSLAWMSLPPPMPAFGQPQQPQAFQRRFNEIVSVTAGKPNRLCKIFNVNAVLGEYSIDDIITAVQGSWDLLESGPNPQLKFHKDTKLLIVVGEENQINVVAEVIRELTINVNQKNAQREAMHREGNRSPEQKLVKPAVGDAKSGSKTP